MLNKSTFSKILRDIVKQLALLRVSVPQQPFADCLDASSLFSRLNIASKWHKSSCRRHWDFGHCHSQKENGRSNHWLDVEASKVLCLTTFWSVFVSVWMWFSDFWSPLWLHLWTEAMLMKRLANNLFVVRIWNAARMLYFEIDEFLLASLISWSYKLRPVK